MRKISNDVNVYVQMKYPISEKKFDVKDEDIKIAKGIYNAISHKLNRTYLEEKVKNLDKAYLEAVYDSARTVFEKHIVRVYSILAGKGWLTESEWKYYCSFIDKNKGIFSDIKLEIGTDMSWKIKVDDKEQLIKDLLKSLGIQVKILPDDGVNEIYEEDSKFIKKLEEDFGIKAASYKFIEKNLDEADYSNGTKKKLKYMTIFDYLKYHMGIKESEILKVVPKASDLIRLLNNSSDKEFSGIINAAKEISKLDENNFWEDYEMYREFYMLAPLVTWYKYSHSRCLTGDVYNEISEQVKPEIFQKFIKILQIHTTKFSGKPKLSLKGNSATYNFELENLSGGRYFATINQNKYDEKFSTAQNKTELTSMSSVTLNNLEYEKSYYVTIWDYFSENDVVCIGQLPVATPGIVWPVAENIEREINEDSFELRFSINGGEGNLSYVACMKDGECSSSSLNDGTQILPIIKGNKLIFQANNLITDKTYTICVYALIDGGRHVLKIINDFIFAPKKLKLLSVIYKPGTTILSLSKDFMQAKLDFSERKWPDSMKNKAIVFACRTDAFPTDKDNGDKTFDINNLKEENYRQNAFNLTFKSNKSFTVLYICGWCDDKLVCKSKIYKINYIVEKKGINFNIGSNNCYGHVLIASDIPKLNIEGIDKKYALVYNDSGASLSDNLQYVFSKKTKASRYEIIPVEQQYKFSFQFIDIGSKLTDKSLCRLAEK